jgi:hypothetical protein
MTISVAWLRSVADTEELVFASDSRLTGGYAWDACPKLLPLARGDSVLAFAGDTSFAYPVMLQVATAVRTSSKSRDRSQDIQELKGHVLDLINGMRGFLHSAVAAVDVTGQERTFLLLGGYSWRQRRFLLWKLHFDASIDAFTFRPASPWGGVDAIRTLAVAGDDVEVFRDALTELLRSRGKRERGGFDFEPFEVLRDMIRSSKHPTIGGPAQVVKVYRHMNAVPFPVAWPSASSGQITLLGRTLLQYERPSTGVLDPDTFLIT